MDVPHINLSASEASTVLGQMPIQHGMIHWGDFIPSAYATILTICKERMISRRAEIAEVSSREDPTGKVKKETNAASKRLGTRLLQLVKLKTISSRGGQVVQILLPNERNSTSAELMQSEEEDGVHEMNFQIGMSGKESELTRRCMMVPIFEVVGHHQHLTFVTNIPLMIRVIENDIYTYPDKSPLELSVIAVDGSFAARVPIPVILPTVGLVDAEVALSVATNVLSGIYLESKNNELKLAFKDL